MKKTTTLYLNYLTKHWSLNKTLTLVGISAATLSAQAQTIPFVTYDPMSKYAFKGIAQGEYMMQNFADVDGDGDLDLLTNGYYDGNTLTLFKNIGSNVAPNYKWVPKTSSVFSQFNNSNFPDGLGADYGTMTAFADMDGDGKTDLVLARQGYYQTNIRLYYKNTGSNALPQYSLLVGSNYPGLPFGKTSDLSGTYNLKPTFADIDGDHKQDLVYINYYGGTISFFKNISTGAGNFNFTQLVGTNNPFNNISAGDNHHAAFNDADGDGKTDLIMVRRSSSSSIQFFKNTGANSSPAYVELLSPNTDNPFSGLNTMGLSTYRTASFADMDGDGLTDFVTNARDNNSFVNNFTGLITYKRIITAGKTSFVQQDPSKTPLSPFLAAQGNNSILNYIDFDGDGDMDMYQIKDGTDQNNLFYFYKNIGSIVSPSWQEFKGTNTFGITSTSIYDFIQFADIDKDGLKEGICFQNNDRANVLYLKNTGTNLAPSFAVYQNGDAANPFNGLNSGGYTFHPAFADLDKDGLIDMVTSSRTTGNIQFFKNTGSATQPGFALWNIPTLSQNPPTSVAYTQIGDIDLNGKPDLIFGTNSNKLEIYLNTTTLSSSPSFTYLPSSANPFDNFQDFGNGGLTYPSLADLDGDGDVDLHVIAGTYYNKQSFVFKNSLRNPVGPTAQSSAKALASPAVLSFIYSDFSLIKGTYNLASIKITDLPTKGALSLSGVALTTKPVVIPVASLGNLSYTATDKSYTGSDSFTFVALDNQDIQSASATMTINITKSTITGISNAFESKITVYPNPFDNQVFVKISEGIIGEVSISLTDAIGTTLKSTSFTKPQGSLAYPFSTEGLTPGLYFIRVAYGDMVEVKKIVKQ